MPSTGLGKARQFVRRAGALAGGSLYYARAAVGRFSPLWRNLCVLRAHVFRRPGGPRSVVAAQPGATDATQRVSPCDSSAPPHYPHLVAAVGRVKSKNDSIRPGRAIASWGGVIVAAWLCWLTISGCRLAGRDGPVSQSLAACRQLSREGMAALEQGQHQRAEQLLAKAVKTCPADIEARRRYAEVLWLRGAQTEAIAQFQQALQHSADDTTLWVRLAEMQLATGRVDLARQSAEKAIDLNPRSAPAWAVRGQVMAASGQLRQALADAHRALGYAPEDKAILLQIARLYRQLNEPHRALQTLQTLADNCHPGQEPAEVLELTAEAQLALGRAEEAAETLAAALSRGKGSAELWCRMAEALWLCGRRPEAFSAAQQALEIQPDHPAAKALLQRFEVAAQGQPVQQR